MVFSPYSADELKTTFGGDRTPTLGGYNIPNPIFAKLGEDGKESPLKTCCELVPLIHAGDILLLLEVPICMNHKVYKWPMLIIL